MPRGITRKRNQRTRRGGYTYKSKSRIQRRSKRNTPSSKRSTPIPRRSIHTSKRINSVTKELRKIVPKDTQFLKDLFNEIDIDGSGRINRDEFHQFFSKNRHSA